MPRGKGQETTYAASAVTDKEIQIHFATWRANLLIGCGAEAFEALFLV